MSTNTSSPSYIAPEYDPVDSVQQWHAIPRFGYPDDVSILFSNDSVEQTRYVYGAIFASCVILVFFTCWTILFLIWKCLGSDKVGILSGHHFVKPHKSSNRNRPYRRPRRVRITVLACCCIIVAFAMLFVTRGINNIYQTQNSVFQSLYDLDTLLLEASNISSNLLEISDDAVILREKLKTINLNNFCPNPYTPEFDTSEITNGMNKIDEFLEPVQNLDDQLSQTRDGIRQANDALEQYGQFGWKPLAFVMPFVVCSSIFFVGTLLAWLGVSSKWFRCFQTWLVLPVFFVVTVVAWVLASLVGIGGVVNADVCSGGEPPGSPDDTILAIMERQEISPETLIYKAILYYVVKGCNAENPFLYLNDYQDQLDSITISIQNFLSTWDNLGSDYLADLCGKDAEFLRPTLDSLRSILLRLSQNAAWALSLLECKRLNSIYQTVVHEAGCTYSVTALAWIFASLLVLGGCGMVVVTLRASWLKVESMDEAIMSVKRRKDARKEEEKEEEDDDEDVESTSIRSKESSDSSSPRSDRDVREHAMVPQASSSKSWEKLPPTASLDHINPIPKNESSTRIY